MSEVATVSLALTSAFTRAGLNVADRRLFGHQKFPVMLGSILNNVTPAVFCVVVIFVTGGIERLPALFLDPGVIAFAAIVQVIALLYGYAFRVASVPRTLVFSKLADLLIPVGIYFAISEFSLYDYAFSVATVFACLPVAIEGLRNRADRALVMPLVTLALVFQGSISPLLLSGEGLALSDWWILTTALLLWRLIISLGIAGLAAAAASTASTAPEAAPAVSRLDVALIATRACLTMVTQLTFVMAIAGERPVLAWPLLNCTPLFAAVGASLILKEQPTRAETLSCFLIFAVAMIRVIV